MGIQHFSGLFVLLCMGVGGALLTLAGEHTFYHLVIPRLRRTQTLQYWLHTSQVRKENASGCRGVQNFSHTHTLLLSCPQPLYLTSFAGNIRPLVFDAQNNT